MQVVGMFFYTFPYIKHPACILYKANPSPYPQSRSIRQYNPFNQQPFHLQFYPVPVHWRIWQLIGPRIFHSRINLSVNLLGAILIIISYDIKTNSKPYHSIISTTIPRSHRIFFHFYISGSEHFHVLCHFVHFKTRLQ